MKALDEDILMVCYYWIKLIFLQTKAKGVAIQMKALDECILLVLFMLLLKQIIC